MIKDVLTVIGIVSTFLKDLLVSAPGGKELSREQRKALLDGQKSSAERQWEEDLERRWGITVPPKNPRGKN